MADADAPSRLDDPRALHDCYIMEDIAYGVERGLSIPTAGYNDSWVEENMEKIVQGAGQGDEFMIVLLEELKSEMGLSPIRRPGKIHTGYRLFTSDRTVGLRELPESEVEGQVCQVR